MDYLRSLSTAAASSLLAKSGLSLPFALGAPVASYASSGQTIWTLHDGTKRDDGTPVSVFTFDASAPGKRSLLPLAKNALRKLRTIRHPDVVRFVDAVEGESVLYVVTERVRPLREVLDGGWAGGVGEKQREEWAVWGLQRVVVALAFVNESCGSTHGNVRTDAVFVSLAGEWKLGGFELLSQPGDEAAVLYTLGSLLPNAHTVASPEVKSAGFSALKPLPPAAYDAYALALLIHTTFNPSLPLPPTTLPPHPQPQPSSRGKIPTSMWGAYKRLLNPNPKTRLSAKAFLELGMSATSDGGGGGGFFATNPLVQTCAALDNLSLMSDSERASFLRTLSPSSPSSAPPAFPPPFLTHKLLPTLLASLPHSPASAPLILPLVLDFGKSLSEEEYRSVVLGPVVGMFKSQDRMVRMALLERMEEFSGRLGRAEVAGGVWPYLQTGFTDTVALIREATVRSIPLIADKLSDRILNNDLLRHLARTQLDPEPSIRTNTCILISRLAPLLSAATRRKMLVPAFARAMRDGFVHCRVAGVRGFVSAAGEGGGMGVEEVAGKVLPVLCGALVDKEKIVRDQAFKAVETFLRRLEAHAATMPDTALPPPSSNALGAPGQQQAASGSGQGGVQAQIVNSAAGAAGALAGWAMSSLSKQLGAADLGGQIVPERPISAPPSTATTTTTNGAAHHPHHPPPTTTSTGTAFSPPLSSISKLPTPTHQPPRGMQLRAQTLPGDKMSALLAEIVDADSGDGGEEGAWDGEGGAGWEEEGELDLMDVNADEGDWSAFEAAPIIPKTSLSTDGAGEDEDEWADPEPEPAPAYRLSTAASPPPLIATSKKPVPVPAVPVVHLSPPSARPAPPPAPPPKSKPAQQDAWGDFSNEPMSPPSSHGSPGQTTTSLAGMSKEEKEREMARRREERKQRIAQAKERKGGK